MALVIVAGLTIGALLLIYLQPRKPDLPSYEYSERRTAYRQPGARSCEPKVLATIRDRSKALAERDRCTDAAEEYRLKTNDLVQQARTADATHAQADLTYDLARMSLWATVGGFLTLIAASLAAYFARNAAYAARGSLDAFIAVEDASLAVEFGGAVIHVQSDGPAHDEYAMHVAITNVGGSMARIRHCSFAGEDIPTDYTLDAGKRFEVQGMLPLESGAPFEFAVHYSSPIRPIAILTVTAEPRLLPHAPHKFKGLLTKSRLSFPKE